MIPSTKADPYLLGFQGGVHYEVLLLDGDNNTHWCVPIGHAGQWELQLFKHELCWWYQPSWHHSIRQESCLPPLPLLQTSPSSQP